MVITLINVTEKWYEYLGISLDRFLMIGIFLCFVFVPTSFFLSGWASNRFIKMEKKIFKRQQTHLWSGGVNTIIIFRFFLKVKISPLYFTTLQSAYQNPFCDDNTFWKVTKTALKFQGFLFWQDLMYNLFNQKYHHNSPRFFTFCGTTFSNGFHL